MYNQKQTVEIVEKLIELTQHGSITWNRQQPPSYMNNFDSRVDSVYITCYANTTLLRVYESNCKNFIDEERYFWETKVMLEFIDSNGISLGSLPVVPNTRELLNAIQYQDPSINNFYNNLLNS